MSPEPSLNHQEPPPPDTESETVGGGGDSQLSEHEQHVLNLLRTVAQVRNTEQARAIAKRLAPHEHAEQIIRAEFDRVRQDRTLKNPVWGLLQSLETFNVESFRPARATTGTQPVLQPMEL